MATRSDLFPPTLIELRTRSMARRPGVYHARGGTLVPCDPPSLEPDGEPLDLARHWSSSSWRSRVVGLVFMACGAVTIAMGLLDAPSRWRLGDLAWMSTGVASFCAGLSIAALLPIRIRTAICMPDFIEIGYFHRRTVFRPHDSLLIVYAESPDGSARIRLYQLHGPGESDLPVDPAVLQQVLARWSTAGTLDTPTAQKRSVARS